MKKTSTKRKPTDQECQDVLGNMFRIKRLPNGKFLLFGFGIHDAGWPLQRARNQDGTLDFADSDGHRAQDPPIQEDPKMLFTKDELLEIARRPGMPDNRCGPWRRSAKTGEFMKSKWEDPLRLMRKPKAVAKKATERKSKPDPVEQEFRNTLLKHKRMILDLTFFQESLAIARKVIEEAQVDLDQQLEWLRSNRNDPPFRLIIKTNQNSPDLLQSLVPNRAKEAKLARVAKDLEALRRGTSKGTPKATPKPYRDGVVI